MKKTLIGTLLLLVSASFAIVAAEVIARILGYQSWQSVVLKNEPTMHEYNSDLGWINKKGQYNYPPYHPDENEIEVTFLETGLRRAHEHQDAKRDDRPKIVFVGGSFTQGWAISDHETWAWKIQKRFPSFEVLNYGTGGYGTYQSLLTLEKILPAIHSPAIVFYGFIGEHELRNVAPAYWLESLSEVSRRAHIFVPYATVDNNNALIRHQPEAYIALPFRDKLAIIPLIEKAFMKVKTYGRVGQKKLVTEKLLLQMHELTTKYGARFIVVILNSSDTVRTHYKGFLESNRIMTIDCSYPLEKGMRVKNEGHPNGVMNSKWASCVEDSIYKLGLATH